MRERVPFLGRMLVGTFGAVALTFTLGIVVSQVFNLHVYRSAREITSNSSPSLAAYSSMMSSLRRLEVRTTEYVRDCRGGVSCGPVPARIQELRRELPERWKAYRQLPVYPGETERWPAIEESLAELEQEVTLTCAAVERGDAAGAEVLLRRGVYPVAGRLDAGLVALMAFDREWGLADARRIERLARRSLVAAVALDALGLALAVAAAVLAIRVVRRYERSLLDRAQDLEAFAGRAAHDIKGPLGSAALALRLARGEVTAERGGALLERARRSIGRVEMLVDSLLEFALAGAATPGAAADLREVVDDVLAELGPLAEEKRVSLQVSAMPAGPVACSPGVLMSVVSNLVRNAITHMGASAVREVHVRGRVASEEGAVRVEVQDTGPGVPEAVADRVFEPFVRGPGVEAPGTGLGLATARRLVVTHGGRIGLDSTCGKGAVFWFEIPRPSEARRDALPQ